MREPGRKGDAHQVYIPDGAERVADQDTQDHSADQHPKRLGAGCDETDHTGTKDIADDVAAGRTGDHMQTAGKSREYRDADTAQQNIDDLRDHAGPEAQTACAEQDAQDRQIDRHAGRQRNEDLRADGHDRCENSA